MNALRDAAGPGALVRSGLLGAAFVLGALVSSSISLEAQTLRGTVRDSATQQPVAGAVVSLIDARDSVRARLITSERGVYSFVLLNNEIRRIRVQRIGFRARTETLPAMNQPVVTVNIVLTALPTMLTPVQVAANSCPKRSDRGAAAALLEQARAGLLATVVARESNSSAQLRIMFERVMAGSGNRILSQKVRFDSGTGTAAFVSAHSAADFVQRGFVEQAGGGELLFHAPDADVLLDDNFVSAYCFQLAEPERNRPNNVGLAFRAARAARDRVDVEGALWIDTVARAIREIEFQYRGLPREVEAMRPGGSIAFREMTSGIVLIHDWSLRLISATVDSTRSAMGSSTPYTLRTTFHASESGGVLARARWPDGYTWHAPLGSLQLTAQTEQMRPAVGVLMKLADTDYQGVTDSTGRLTIPNLIRGPFRLVIPDERLARIGVEMETPVRFVVNSDSTISANVVALSAESYVAARCSQSERQHSTADSLPFVAGRVTAPDPTSLQGLQISISRETRLGEWQPIDDYYRLGSDGLFWLCSRQLRPRQSVRIELRHNGVLRSSTPLTLDNRLSVVGIFYTPP